MNIPIDYAWLEATGLAAVRFTAFVFIAPPFSYAGFPARIKAMLAVCLAVVVSSKVAPGYTVLGTGEFIGALIVQVAVGALLGFLVHIIFSAVQSAGGLIDTFGGFQLAQGFDPGMQIHGAQFTRVFQMLALALLFASNGYQLILAGLVRSFDAVPVDGMLNLANPIELMVNATSQALVASLQIAGPLILVLFLADAGLGLITRVAPQLNAFAMGFPLKILMTFTLITTVLAVMPNVIAALSDDAFKAMLGGAQ